MGGAFSVVGSRVASQASVPHQDMATVIALLALWTSLGGAIGSAIGVFFRSIVCIRSNNPRSCGCMDVSFLKQDHPNARADHIFDSGKMPENLTKQLSGKLTAAQILKIYGSIKLARNQPEDIREGVIRAYNDTVYYLYLPALILCMLLLVHHHHAELTDDSAIIPLIAAFMTTNFFLGDTHNAIERKKVIVAANEDEVEQVQRPASISGSGLPELEAQSPDETKRRVDEH